jgi:hypothetical protein
MTTSVSALCSDFYINQKIALKMDLPTSRETVLDMFDRIRKDVPSMDRFRRFEDELALESPERNSQYSWFSLAAPGGTAIRSGWVNPESLEDAYRLHRLILEIAPYYLTISPIDVEYIELIFGFDIEAEANRNEIVFDALAGGAESRGALASLIDSEHERVLDYQPFIGLTLNQSCNLQAFIEVKTRTRAAEIAGEHLLAHHPGERIAIGEVPEGLKRERLDRLTELQRAITAERNERSIGRRVRAIVDRGTPESPIEARVWWQAHDIDGVTMLDAYAAPGSLVDVAVTGVVDDFDLSASLVRVTSPAQERRAVTLPVVSNLTAASASFGH